MTEVKNPTPATPQTDVVIVDKNDLTLQPSAADQATSMMQMIERVVTNPNVNVEAMKAVLDMNRQLMRDQAERTFNQQMALMATEMPRIKKKGKVEYLVDSKGPKDGPKQEAFKHARWEDIDAGIRPLLVKYGFSLSFTTEPRSGDGGGLTMVGRLSHKDGHFIEGRLAVALDNSGGKNNIQGMGSSSSYGKRYVTCMMLNIITENEDDDGTGAECISTEQAVEIDLKIVEVKADKAAFLKYLKVPDVLSIRAKDYPKAITALKAKAESNAKATKKGAA